MCVKMGPFNIRSERLEKAGTANFKKKHRIEGGDNAKNLLRFIFYKYNLKRLKKPL